jgi:hypothetical protein
VILNSIYNWVYDEPRNSRDFVIFGPIGHGKSTILRTLCKELDKKQRLAATFFVSPDDNATRDPHNIIRTIAYQLAFYHPGLHRQISSALRDSSMAEYVSLNDLIKKLIYEPLKYNTAVYPRGLPSFVIVIDGLDHCSLAGNAEGGSLLSSLSSAIARGSNAGKLIVTTGSYHHRQITGFSDELGIHDAQTIHGDVYCYLKSEFSRIVTERPGIGLPWPSEHDVSILVEWTDFFFLYAATVMRYIGSPDGHDPPGRLQDILHGRCKLEASPFKKMDSLCLHILDSIVTAVEEYDRPTVCRNIRLVLGALAFLQTRLSVESLAHFLGLEMTALRLALFRLSAMVHVPQNDSETVWLRHSFFIGFFTNPDRCSDKRFYIKPVQMQAQLTQLCFDAMDKSLRQDICRIATLKQPNAQINDLHERIGKCMRPEVRYSCMYWTTHLLQAQAAGPTPELSEDLARFSAKTYHWIEAVSLLDMVPPAQRCLRRVVETSLVC